MHGTMNIKLNSFCIVIKHSLAVPSVNLDMGMGFLHWPVYQLSWQVYVVFLSISRQMLRYMPLMPSFPICSISLII